MKKILYLLLFTAASLSGFAQLGYRYDVIPGTDNTFAIPPREVKAISYVSTKTVVPFNEYTTYNFAQLTGNMTLNVTNTSTYTGDRMTCLFSADATNRSVTFNTGFSANGNLIVPASSRVTVEFTFNGSAWKEVSRQNPLPLRTATTYTATGSITVTAAELSGGLLVAATSTATTTFTLPTAAQIVTQTGATAGTTLEFVVVNNGASNGTVTVAVGSGIVASDFPGTNTLTRTGSATVGVAVFGLTFITTSAAVLTRIR